MTLWKSVNGKRMPLTPEEEAEVLAERAAEAAKPKPTAAEKLEGHMSPVLHKFVEKMAAATGKPNLLQEIADEMDAEGKL